MASQENISLKSLREQIYEGLRIQMNEGRVRPGAFLNLNEISNELGMSRTPLRDALFQLEFEGFVTIFPRRGVMVNALTLEKIRSIYEILGALESSVMVHAALRFSDDAVVMMEKHNQQMRKALDRNNFSAYYEANLKLHNVYLDMSDNAELLNLIKMNKERLYDFPRNKVYVKEWEQHSVGEHDELIGHLRRGRFNDAADFMRDVHWSFSVQERFIRKYYFADRAELDISEEGAD